MIDKERVNELEGRSKEIVQWKSKREQKGFLKSRARGYGRSGWGEKEIEEEKREKKSLQRTKGEE